jgi:hypothetical protein
LIIDIIDTSLKGLSVTKITNTLKLIPWFQRFIFIIFIAKGRGKINLWNQGMKLTVLLLHLVLINFIETHY